MSLLRALTPLRRGASGAAALRVFTRSLGNKLPDPLEHAVGKERAELEAEQEGYELFNRFPITTDESMGNSKDDPILVPSFEDVRPVGISHNDSSYMSWFNLRKGKVHFVPQFGKYFKLLSVDEYEATEQAAKVHAFNKQDKRGE